MSLSLRSISCLRESIRVRLRLISSVFSAAFLLTLFVRDVMSPTCCVTWAVDADVSVVVALISSIAAEILLILSALFADAAIRASTFCVSSPDASLTLRMIPPMAFFSSFTAYTSCPTSSLDRVTMSFVRSAFPFCTPAASSFTLMLASVMGFAIKNPVMIATAMATATQIRRMIISVFFIPLVMSSKLAAGVT